MPRSELFSGHIYWRENKKKWQGILFHVDSDGKRRQKTKLFSEKKRESAPAFESWKNELNEKARKLSVEVSKETAIEMTASSGRKKTVGERLSNSLGPCV